jgi:flagellar biosynthesis chaperone FliJ
MTMARVKKNLSLDERIEKAQEKVAKYSQPYQNAINELKKLLDEKNKSQQDLLLDAVTTSKRSYDEIMAFIQSDPTEDVWYEPGQGF